MCFLKLLENASKRQLSALLERLYLLYFGLFPVGLIAHLRFLLSHFTGWDQCGSDRFYTQKLFRGPSGSRNITSSEQGFGKISAYMLRRSLYSGTPFCILEGFVINRLGPHSINLSSTGSRPPATHTLYYHFVVAVSITNLPSPIHYLFFRKRITILTMLEFSLREKKLPSLFISVLSRCMTDISNFQITFNSFDGFGVIYALLNVFLVLQMVESPFRVNLTVLLVYVSVLLY